MVLLYLTLLSVAALASCSPVHSVSADLAKLHKSIATQLNLAQPEVGTNPLFSSVIRSLNNSCQADMTLMNATLDVYMRIFSSLLSKHSTEDLHKLQRHMLKLKSHLSRLQHSKDELLSRIHSIQVDEPLVQRKALAEYLEVYHAASGLLHSRD